MTTWEKYVDVILLFSQDVERSKSFYRDIFGLVPDRHDNDFHLVTENDDHSASFRFQNMSVTLLDVHSAHERIGPAPFITDEARSLFQITNAMDPDLCDVDTAATELAEHGGVRPASSRSPSVSCTRDRCHCFLPVKPPWLSASGTPHNSRRERAKSGIGKNLVRPSS